MTEPSQYFKGRTVQEQMDEVIGYVDVRAEEVAAAKADDVLQPAEDAKDAAIAAQEAAEDARDTTLAALPQIQSDLNAVTLRVQTAEGQIVTIQGRVTALETADGQNVKLTGEHAIGNYAVLLTDNQVKNGILTMNTGINGIKFPVCDKMPENTANKYLKLFSITKRATMLMFIVKTSSQYMTVLADIRTNTISVRTEIHGTDRFANTDIIVMADDTKYYFFMKYPQNRKFILDFENLNPLFADGTYPFADIDIGFFDRTLVDEPQVGDVYTIKYTSGAL